MYENIDEYIALFPENIREILQKVREAIKKNAPDATEKISWKMPTFYQKENLIHFAAAKNHIGIYPGSEAIEVFKDKIADYKHSKGALQLPLSKPIPYDLIEEIVKFRVKTVTEKKK